MDDTAPAPTTRTVTANGLEFAYLSAGPEDGPLALCLHGFPDTAHTWRHLLPRLADAGYRAVAPFLGAMRPPRSRPTAATTPGPWPSTPAPSTRRWAAAATP